MQWFSLLSQGYVILLLKSITNLFQFKTTMWLTSWSIDGARSFLMDVPTGICDKKGSSAWSNTEFTLSSRVLIGIFGELRIGWDTCECRHWHSYASAKTKLTVASITRRDICFLWLGYDLPTCFRGLKDDTRTGRQRAKWDVLRTPFQHPTNK